MTTRTGFEMAKIEYLVAVIFTRFMMWIGGFDLFERSGASLFAIAVSIVVGFILVAIYKGIEGIFLRKTIKENNE